MTPDQLVKRNQTLTRLLGEVADLVGLALASTSDIDDKTKFKLYEKLDRARKVIKG